MGVYIKGMQMPPLCMKCPLCHSDDAYRCAITGESYSWGLTARPSTCPLIPVPDHGRLIDVDALMDDCPIHFSQTTQEVCIPWEFVTTASAVIPADKEIDNGKVR